MQITQTTDSQTIHSNKQQKMKLYYLLSTQIKCSI